SRSLPERPSPRSLGRAPSTRSSWPARRGVAMRSTRAIRTIWRSSARSSPACVSSLSDFFTSSLLHRFASLLLRLLRLLLGLRSVAAVVVVAVGRRLAALEGVPGLRRDDPVAVDEREAVVGRARVLAGLDELEAEERNGGGEVLADGLVLARKLLRVS